MKLLVIEDELDLLATVVEFLKKEKYLVEVAGSCAEAMDKIVAYDYNCILLDIGLPDGNGLEVLKKLKELDKLDAVIIISAKDSLDDKLLGLELGADDYLTKPFHLAELNARIKAVLRRKSLDGKYEVSINNVVLDFDERRLLVDGEEMVLNRKEFDILAFFVMNKNRVINRNSLAEHVWGDNMDEADSFDFIYSQIKNLRKKLKVHGADLEIQAMYGVGYKLSV